MAETKRKDWELDTVVQKEQGLGDPLFPFYNEYTSMVPPKGEPQLTYSGWLRKLAERLRREQNTPAQSVASALREKITK